MASTFNPNDPGFLASVGGGDAPGAPAPAALLGPDGQSLASTAPADGTLDLTHDTTANLELPTPFDNLATADETPIPDDAQSQAIADVFRRRQARADTTAPVPPTGSADSTASESKAADASNGESTDAPGSEGTELTQPADDPGSAPFDPSSGDPTDATPPTDAPDTPPEPFQPSFRVEFADGEYELTQEKARELVGLGAWADSLKPELRNTFAAIEEGHAIAISREDAQAFYAWKQDQGGSGANRTAGGVQGSAAPLLDDLDPDVAALFQQQQQEIAQLRASIEQTVQAGVPVAQAAQAAEYDRIANLADQTVAAYGTARGLSDEEIGGLYTVAVNSGVIRGFVEADTHRAPDGRVIRQGDFAKAITKALDFALVQDPALHARTLTPTPNAVLTPAQQAARDADQLSQQRTAAKKSRGSSLASAPSAAITTPARDPRLMTKAEQRAGMADMIRANVAGS